VTYGWLLYELTQGLFLLGAMALAVAALRLLIRPNFTLLAFGIMSMAETLRNASVVIWGVSNWPPEAYLMLTVARCLQVAGAAMFIWVFTRHQYGHWLWVVFMGLATLGAFMV